MLIFLQHVLSSWPMPVFPSPNNELVLRPPQKPKKKTCLCESGGTLLNILMFIFPQNVNCLQSLFYVPALICTFLLFQVPPCPRSPIPCPI